MPLASENPTTEDYYVTQAALGALVASQVAQSFPLLDPLDLTGTFETARSLAADVAASQGAAAVGFATDYYEEFRLASGVRAPLRIPVIDLASPESLDQQLDRAAAELLEAVDSVIDEVYLADLALQLQAELQGGAQALVADAGRDQLFAAMRADREATGWARVTRVGACSFCRMLASRGPVYSKDAVDFRAHAVLNGRGGVCQCTAEPVIRASHEPTAQARSDAALWERISEEGFVGSDARNEFRRHIEGRTDGKRRPRLDGKRLGNKRPAQVQGQRLGFDHLSPTQLTHQLSVVERLPDSEYRRKQVARITSRLKALGQ